MIQPSHPYEIHITTTISDVEVGGFVNLCNVIGVKPIILELPNVSTQEVMTKSVVTVPTVEQAIDVANTQAAQLTGRGFAVARVKIETVPTHPQAPSATNRMVLKPGAHFETHYKILIASSATDLAIDELTAEFNLHKSKNVLKRFDDGTYHQMVTDRDYNTTSERFIERTSTITKRMSDRGLALVKRPIVEFSIYDTKPHHDSQWLGTSHA